ncbi:FxsA family protein [candidate division KSB1 bacterium]
MFLKLFLLFVTVPIIELWLLIDIGRTIGTFQTVGLIIITGLAGAFLAKMQGLTTLHKIRENLTNGIMPSSELLDGLLILLAGGLLITPGLLTDALSFILLIPQSRIYVKKYLLRKFNGWMQSQRADVRFYNDSDEWEI